MPVSGLVIVLTDDKGDDHIDTMSAIRANPRVVIGEGPVDGRLPVVLETDTDAEDRAQVRWLESLPGVALVEIAYHDFSDVRKDVDDPEGAKR